ncbi:MAG: hypothetical protein WDA24_06830 [Tissierellales bacterium]
MKLLKSDKGITVPLVLIIFSIMLIFGLVALSIVSSQSIFNIVDDSSQKALKYAEAGYNKYLWHLNDDLNFYSTEAHDKLMNEPYPFEEGYFMLDVTKPSDTDRFVTIKSTGWSKDNPDIKKTILAKIRKKQFVHNVYVSDSDGPNIWWTTGDESHGPLHTNTDIRIQNKPIFYDTVSYVNKLEKGSGYNPDFKVKEPSQPMKTSKLEFPDSNKNLRDWAEKDGMLFYGRTCIYLEGDKLSIRNQNSDEIIVKNISRDIQNLVIYVDKVPDSDKSIIGGTGKFGIKSGNVFVSGKLEGRLTIGAEDTIYITYSDPTEWYDYNPSDIYNNNKKPNQPPTTFPWVGSNEKAYPQSGGIEYINTRFSGNKNGTGTVMSSYDIEKNIYTRYSFDGNTNNPGKDMLGLIANNNIYILHYGWPKKAYNSDGRDDSWNFEWGSWVDNGGYVRKKLDSGTYNNIKIRYRGTYSTLRVGYGKNDHLKPGEFDVWEPDEKWSTKNKTYDMGPHNITIHAALFSVNQGFGYEDYDKGPRKGDITLWGNLTQRERKPVGTIGRTGYNKKYAHDPRMFYDYPPHILEPTNVGWEIHEWKELNN